MKDSEFTGEGFRAIAFWLCLVAAAFLARFVFRWSWRGQYRSRFRLCNSSHIKSACSYSDRLYIATTACKKAFGSASRPLYPIQSHLRPHNIIPPFPHSHYRNDAQSSTGAVVVLVDGAHTASNRAIPRPVP